MMERRQYNNPWAEKLSQVSLPDGGAAWVAMETLLDKEMPVDWKRDRRRWLLLMLLLLLLIGICNCPGRGRFSAAKTEGPARPSPRPSGRAGLHGGGTGSAPSPGDTGSAPSPGPASDGGTGSGSPSGPSPAGEAGPGPSPDGSVVSAPSPAGEAGPRPSPASEVGPGPLPAGTAEPSRLPVRSGKTLIEARSGKSHHHPHPVSRHPQPVSKTTGGDLEEGDSLAVTPDRPVRKGGMVNGGVVKRDQAKGGPAKDTSAAPPVRKTVLKDSSHKKPPTPPKEDQQKEKQGGWMVGIGLNQFFTVGGQQASSFNSGGITGTLRDYIPVPMVRYYFNPKLYVQLEVQINTPQYTKKNVVISAPPPDSIQGTQTTIQTSASIQKLFYFNVPLSIHYEPFDNLNLGAGLQFSRLSNAIGSFDSTYWTLGSTDTVNLKATRSFKGDPLYQSIKTNEFRFLVDASYTYQHFILGLRYNQALSKFIHIEIAPGQITQSRNSSLQLYLRYIIWDGRKKKPLIPAK